MDASNSNKRAVEAPREGESSVKRMNVAMGLETLDCSVCLEPLRPPIFQCSVGHFICSSCRAKILNKKCHICSVKTSFQRCFGMEHVVQSVTGPCFNAKHGCAEKVTYYKKEEHEKACTYAPMLLPRVRLWLRWANNGAPGPFHHPAQVSVYNPSRLWHGVSQLTTGLACSAIQWEQPFFPA